MAEMMSFRVPTRTRLQLERLSRRYHSMTAVVVAAVDRMYAQEVDNMAISDRHTVTPQDPRFTAHVTLDRDGYGLDQASLSESAYEASLDRVIALIRERLPNQFPGVEFTFVKSSTVGYCPPIRVEDWDANGDDQSTAAVDMRQDIEEAIAEIIADYDAWVIYDSDSDA